MYSKRLYLFFSLLIFSLLLMTFQAKTNPINPVSFFSYPLNTLNNFIHQGISLVKTPLSIVRTAVGENDQLEEEIAELKLKLQEYTEVKEENKRLKQALGIKISHPQYVTTAVLISKGPDRWVKAMVLDKGFEDGIEKEMIAISPDGLAGKIVRVWPSYAEMLLITDSSFSVSVRLQNNRIEGILTGSGNDYCLLKYVSNEVNVKAGDILITSGLDKFFPKGIHTGKIRMAKKTSPDLFQHVEVDPFVDTSKLEEVVIIKR